MAPAPAERQFGFPIAPRAPWWVWLLATLAHLPLLALPTTRFRSHDPSRPSLVNVRATPLRQVERLVAIPYEHSVRALDAPARNGIGATRQAEPTALAPTRVAPVTPSIPPSDRGRGRPAAASPRTVDPVATPARAPARRIGPVYAGGALWVRPLPISPQELAARLRERTHGEKVDSAVTAIIQDYLDRLALDEAGRPAPLPSWTTTIGGKTVGIDSKWIYLGPLRVPAFLLALIPLGVQANPTQADMNRKLNAMREDLMDAARRAGNYADFKAAVGQLREQTQRKRDMDKAQRTVPADTGGH